MKTAVKTVIGKIKLKKDDEVQIMAGKARGQTGKVLRIDRVKGRVYVEGLNMVSRHTKPRKADEKGGIFKVEAGIAVSSVLLVCKTCQKGVRTRTKVEDSGAKARQCAKCGGIIS